MYQVYRQTMGNKPLLFGGGSPDTSGSEDLSGVQFINGTRPGNPQLVELALSLIHIFPAGTGLSGVSHYRLRGNLCCAGAEHRSGR